MIICLTRLIEINVVKRQFGVNVVFRKKYYEYVECTNQSINSYKHAIVIHCVLNILFLLFLLQVMEKVV